MSTPHERFFRQTWSGRSTNRFEDYIPGLHAGSPYDILAMVQNFNPRQCSASVVKATLEHLTLGRIPWSVATRQESETHPHVQAATASLSLLDRIVGLCPSEATLKEYARPLVLASLDGILGWIHFCFDFRLAYHVAMQEEGFSFAIYFHIPFKISFFDPDDDCGPFSALNHSKSYLHLLLRLWTTPDRSQSGNPLYINWVMPDMCPALYLLSAVFQDCCGDGLAFVEEVMSHDLGKRFAKTTSLRAVQVAQAAMDTHCPEGIYGYAAKLLKFVQDVYLYKDHRLRQFFDDGDFMISFTRMFHRLSSHFLSQEALSDKLVEPIINLYIHAMYSRSPEATPHRIVIRNFRGLLTGGYLEMHARCLSKARGNVLESFCSWTMFPHILDVLTSWESNGMGDQLARLFDFPDSRDYWTTFWSTVQSRIRVYKLVRMDKGWSNTCDNLLCTREAERQDSSRTKQCSRCSSMTYCSPECQRGDWFDRHHNECLSARGENFELSEAGSLYSHRSRAFHTQYLEWLFEQRAVDIDAACAEGKHVAMETKIPVFNCTGLGDKLEPFNPSDLLGQLSQTPNDTSENIRSFRKSRYEQLVRTTRSLPTEDEQLVEGVFQHESESAIHLLVLLKRMEGGYKARYSTFYILQEPPEAE